MTSDSLLAASLKRQIKQPQETSEFVLVDAAYICAIAFIIADELHSIMNSISRSLSV